MRNEDREQLWLLLLLCALFTLAYFLSRMVPVVSR